MERTILTLNNVRLAAIECDVDEDVAQIAFDDTVDALKRRYK